ncbi:uncharacterized protein [Medicago truncatula]|uniref:uncharacterized protein n=1 Tax=Medicago truncatula TaxID=3880 RepID=UPI000D2F3F94|nr:uncharacterized protein LOC112420195 [Medicago truncatula]
MPIFVPHCRYVPYLQNHSFFLLLHNHESSRTIRRYHHGNEGKFHAFTTAHTEPTFRNVHFLKPIANSIQEVNVNQSSSSCSVFKPKEWPLKIRFNWWRYPHTKWVKWVDQLKPKYESVWKKAGIFEPIMSTKSRVMKNQDLVYGISEKWCSETNCFVFPFGEATITLEDVIVLGGYSLFGYPVFTQLDDPEMRDMENKLKLARKKLRQSKKNLFKKTLVDLKKCPDKFSLLLEVNVLQSPFYLVQVDNVRLALDSAINDFIWRPYVRGNPIALAPAVLASIYKDLTLFKKTIVGLSKYYVGGDRFPLEVNLRSPFYLVQIWVWERYPNKCGMFYPNNEIWVPFKKDLDTNMLSFVICLRVAELVGFESIEQYLPHRVAMQFGIDQDVPSYVARFNETKYIAWENYCRPISYKNLYFPPRLFEADVIMRYAKWWKQLVLGHGDFVKNIVKRKRSVSSRKPRAHVGKASKSGVDFSVPPGFPPNLVDTHIYGKFCADVPAENSAHDCVKSKHLINQCSSASLADYEDFEKILPLIRPILEENVELSLGALEDDFEDANGRKEAWKSNDRAFLSETQGESHSYAFKNKVTVVQHSDMAEGAKEIVEERKERDDEVVILLKEHSLKNQEEMARLARQQEEMLRLMDLREKRDEELRQLLTSVLRNQQPPSS